MKAKTILVSFSLCISLLFSGCYGSFNLVKSVYEFNNDAIDDRFGQQVLFWGLCFIPVYPIASLLDVFILNLVEFWSGENPLSMKEGEKDTQTACIDGENYTITAMKNTFLITNESDETVAIKYYENEEAWYVEKDGVAQKLSSLERVNGKKIIKQYLPNGKFKASTI